LAGDMDLFCNLIDRFLAESAELLEHVVTAVSEGNRASANAILHRLRGQSGNIGAKALAEELGRLEMAALDGGLTLEALAACQIRLNGLVLELSVWRQAHRVSQTIIPDLAAPLDASLLQLLKDQLARKNLAALSRFKDCRPGLRALLGEADFNDLEAAIGALDFTRALGILDNSCPRDDIEP